MQKSDLKPGMRVILNNGGEYFIIDENIMVDQHDGWIPFDNYNENLENYWSEKYNIKFLYKYNTKTKRWEEIPQSVQEKMTISIEYTIKVTKNGNKTTVLLPDGTQASTTCLPEDSYDEDKGVNIAYLKARMKSDAKQLKELTK